MTLILSDDRAVRDNSLWRFPTRKALALAIYRQDKAALRRSFDEQIVVVDLYPLLPLFRSAQAIALVVTYRRTALPIRVPLTFRPLIPLLPAASAHGASVWTDRSACYAVAPAPTGGDGKYDSKSYCNGNG
jgi:hypothetical protein